MAVLASPEHEILKKGLGTRNAVMKVMPQGPIKEAIEFPIKEILPEPFKAKPTSSPRSLKSLSPRDRLPMFLK